MSTMAAWRLTLGPATRLWRGECIQESPAQRVLAIRLQQRQRVHHRVHRGKAAQNRGVYAERMLFSNIRKPKVTTQLARGLMVGCTLIMMGRGWALGQAQEQQQQPPQGSPTESPGQAGGKELPDAPGETKKESANPVQQVQDKTKQAVGYIKNAAPPRLIRARDYESTCCR